VGDSSSADDVDEATGDDDDALGLAIAELTRDGRAG
jgi:hypothetical protein